MSAFLTQTEASNLVPCRKNTTGFFTVLRITHSFDGRILENLALSVVQAGDYQLNDLSIKLEGQGAAAGMTQNART
ncbi:hypothetical protein [Roseibium sp. MMSF_3544]|uniref:hypothetical protein n=1 Tax=unclassified Roseibium TaxID=2629323 RepID=UPI00274013C2|nr:hypothetical protein [Roseibium sp. MMSF_3544]